MSITAVAKKAKVSKATVSRVMNGTAVVSPKTADRVRRAVEELNFHPDINARTLGSGRSGLYGLIISDITNPYFPELVKAFEEIAVEHGQDVLISNTDYDPQRMERCVMRMLQRKVDGVAIMTSEMEESLIRSFSARQIPTVFMDASTNVRGAAVVSVDYAAGVGEALEHLFELGHKKIAFISGPLRLASAEVRSSAFAKKMRRHGIKVDPRLLEEGDHRIGGGFEAMERILHRGGKPTAVMASNDLTAIGAMGALQKAGFSIPRDVSVVGFDDIQLSAYTSPPLTTVHVPRRELAATAFRSLFRTPGDRVKKTSRRNITLIEPKLLVRSSTGPMRKRRKKEK